MELGEFFHDKFLSFKQKPSEELWGKVSASKELKSFNRKKLAKRILYISVPTLVVISAVSLLFVKNSQKNEFLNRNEQYSEVITANSEITEEVFDENSDLKQNLSFENTTNTSTLLEEKKNENVAINTTRQNIYDNNRQFLNNSSANANFTADILSENDEKEELKQVIAETAEKVSKNENNETKNIKTNDNPSLPLIFSHDTIICRNSELTLYVLNAQKVTWNIGSRDQIIKIYPEVTTTYSANVVKSDGQDTTIYMKVEVTQCGLYIPNAFTPNGDGINDEFKIQVPEELKIVSFEMSIFEPSGRLIFHSKNPTQGWDGNFQGGNSPQGAYFYVVKYKDNRNEKRVNKGQIILYR